jgi:hypothetical protein
VRELSCSGEQLAHAASFGAICCVRHAFSLRGVALR